MIARKLETELSILRTEFPIIAILGPRQSGKTTLARAFFRGFEYYSLEDPDLKEVASNDPKGFLGNIGPRFILDEIQNVPELFSYLQKIADDKKQMGEIVVTGSQNYLVSEKISQSLSGRVGIATLFPFLYSEIFQHSSLSSTPWEYILQGSYPPVYDRNIRSQRFYANYFETYVERDVRKMLNINNLAVFRRFMKLLAGRTGQIINKNEVAAQAGISHFTVEKWLSVLEQSYIIFRLQPYYKNIIKRQVKQPKLYFYDSGLACWMAGIKTRNELDIHYLKGALFENMMVSEIVKNNFIEYASANNVFFWRDNHGSEIDVLIEKGNGLQFIEIKSSATFRSDYLKPMQRIASRFGNDYLSKKLIYAGDMTLKQQDIDIEPWDAYLTMGT